MTFNIEIEDIEVIRIIYELRRASLHYEAFAKEYDREQCLLVASRVEMQYRAQNKSYDQEQQEPPV